MNLYEARRIAEKHGYKVIKNDDYLMEKAIAIVKHCGYTIKNNLFESEEDDKVKKPSFKRDENGEYIAGTNSDDTYNYIMRHGTGSLGEVCDFLINPDRNNSKLCLFDELFKENNDDINKVVENIISLMELTTGKGTSQERFNKECRTLKGMALKNDKIELRRYLTNIALKYGGLGLSGGRYGR